MGININNLSVSQAKQYYLDYNNGNKCGLTDIQYKTLCTKFRDYIEIWDQDDTTYQTGSERLNFDADDAGLDFGDYAIGAGAIGAGAAGSAIGGLGEVGNMFGNVWDKTGGKLFGGGKSATTGSTGGTGGTSGTEGANGVNGTSGTEGSGGSNGTEATDGGNGADKAADKVDVLLLVAAALTFAMALIAKSKNANADAVEACAEAQGELETEQVNLANQVIEMEKKQDEMEEQQELAIATQEEGQANILELEGAFNYYYTKVQDGTATPQDIAMLQGLQMAMGLKQGETNAATLGINEEITKIGEELYAGVTDNIAISNEFTEYVADFDKATKTAAIVQGVMMTVACAGAALTAMKCVARCCEMGPWMIAAYLAAAALAGSAAVMYGEMALTNLTTYRKTADDTINIRETTEEVSADTSEFQESSVEFWEETTEATNEENLFTLTPTYAMSASVSTSSQTAGTSGTGGISTGGDQEDDPNKKDKK